MLNAIPLLALLAVTIAHADPADTALPPGPAPGNLWKVSDGVYRGARIDDPDNMNYLVNSLHVKTIINLQGGDAPPAPAAPAEEGIGNSAL